MKVIHSLERLETCGQQDFIDQVKQSELTQPSLVTQGFYLLQVEH
jgi:hypothetical protein